MVIHTGNTARTSVIWQTDLEVVLLTDREQILNEISYQVVMDIAAGFLKDGTITADCYRKFEGKMQQKYQPTWGRIFTDIS